MSDDDLTPEESPQKEAGSGDRQISEDPSATEELQNAVQKFAEKKPEKLFEMMAVEMTSGGNPLHHRMNQEHISQVLELASRHDEREYELQKTSQQNAFEERSSNRLYCFLAFALILGLTVLVMFLFKEKPEVLIPVLTGLGGLFTGFVGGWGLGTKQ